MEKTVKYTLELELEDTKTCDKCLLCNTEYAKCKALKKTLLTNENAEFIRPLTCPLKEVDNWDLK